ncbi:hypothetical protein J3R83DRAFT_2505 [Lanmaoa asiatica]|nr:hypothetical protein J3R83DRAFT_2505 [Lanmaoa asiatica]
MKRSIANSEAKQAKKLESALFDLRVDLNYVLHFPKAEKYVSLFPPEVRRSGSTAAPGRCIVRRQRRAIESARNDTPTDGTRELAHSLK